MTENHRHDPVTGDVYIEGDTAEAELAATEVVSDASVEIARIEAEKEITLAKIAAKQVEPDLEMQLAAALAELDALRAIVSPPEPEPVEMPAPVVVVDDSGPEDATAMDESLPVPEAETEHQEPRRKSVGLGMW